MLKATVSGSFHRHMAGIYEAVGQLRSRNIAVLSPSDPRVVDNIGEFLFVASDKLRSIRLVQDRHFEAMRASDFCGWFARTDILDLLRVWRWARRILLEFRCSQQQVHSTLR
jgi:hypothetical protein